MFELPTTTSLKSSASMAKPFGFMIYDFRFMILKMLWHSTLN